MGLCLMGETRLGFYKCISGIQVEVRLPDATLENRAESLLYGELYPNTKLAYPVPNSPIYAIYTSMDKNGLLGPYHNIHKTYQPCPIVLRVSKLLLYNIYQN